MSKLKEKDFSKTIKSKLVDFIVFNMEATGGSVPDLHILPKLDLLPPFWMEVKLFHRGAKKIVFQHGQTQWLGNYSVHGKSCVCILSEEDKRITVYDGKDAKRIERMAYSIGDNSHAKVRPLYSSLLGQKGTDWQAISLALQEWLMA